MESIASNSLRISRPIRGSSPIIFENSMLDPTWTHQFKWHDFHGCIRMKINALRGSPNALPLSYRGTAQRIYFHSNTAMEIMPLELVSPRWVQHGVFEDYW